MTIATSTTIVTHAVTVVHTMIRTMVGPVLPRATVVVPPPPATQYLIPDLIYIRQLAVCRHVLLRACKLISIPRPHLVQPL